MKNQNFYVNYHSNDFNSIFRATLSITCFKSLIHEQNSENTEVVTSLLPETIELLDVVCHSKYSYASMVCDRFLRNGGNIS